MTLDGWGGERAICHSPCHSDETRLTLTYQASLPLALATHLLLCDTFCAVLQGVLNATFLLCPRAQRGDPLTR